MNTNGSGPVLAIALDAAEPRLIEQWINDRELPNLKSLLTRGVFSRLSSTADWLSGSPWPTFYTGTMPSDHGLYHFLQWRGDQMRPVSPNPDWLAPRPFWRSLSEKGHRVIVIDMPMTFSLGPFNGVEICGWATHDRLAPPTSYPPSIMNWIHREFGLPPLSVEVSGPQRFKSLFQLRDQLIQATRQVADLAQKLMKRETWDLFMVGFGATHRGGHKLWNLSSSWGNARSEDKKEFSHALRDVYVACDDAVGQLVEAAGVEATILVFSLHGMGPNTSRVRILPTMLDRILGKEAYSSEALLRKLKEILPFEFGYSMYRLLPRSLRKKLNALRYTQHIGINWSVTPAFSLRADLQGYIRINLRGREIAGIVELGEEYDRLCEDIIEGLTTFVDANTGKPVVESVMRSDQLFPQGRRQHNLPDLIVRWASSPAANHRTIVSTPYGSIPWPTPGRNPDGRSGNHRPEGFLLASGNGIQPGLQIESAHILDLAPTICALLNVPKPNEMCGNVLSVI